MTSNEIRASFLKYFEQHGHRIVSSAPLVPGDDPTLLFTNAGMNQFKDVFLGRDKRAYSRAATAQKCMRVSGKHNDLDNVGPSLRHHTFFEMLGNFSFGDYFKKEAIEFAWTLLTDVWKLPKDRLMASVFKGDSAVPRDTEAYDIWRRFLPADRVVEYGADDNFWQMGETGPCGRCSEIYYVQDGGGADPKIEIWNNVFMEFDRGAGGTLTPLPAPSIDTGMGLERVTAVLQGKTSNYDTDVFAPVFKEISSITGLNHEGTMTPTDVSLRVVADHIRAMTFLIADGVMPSNEWRGYVLRKIMRRAMRHGKHLTIANPGPFLYRLVSVLAREMGDAYPELRANREMIEKTILAEEQRFDELLGEGLPRLEAELAKVSGTKGKILSGEAAFKLYDTFGMPFDFIEDTAATQGVIVDKTAFDVAMEAQRGKGRAQSAFGGGKQDEFAIAVEDEQPLKNAGDHFEGYTSTRLTGVPIVALFDASRRTTEALPTGATGYVALARTPFYVESGGQVSDSGRIVNDGSGATAEVDGLARIRPGFPRAHRVRVSAGELKVRDIVTAEVDADARDATRRNHTATHLLHAALRQVLGGHVKQAGSLVAPDRLRFDFVHFQPVTRAEMDTIERIVNEQIVRNAAVQTEVRSTDEAIASGAMALFGEKYGDKVRVVSVPGFSMELCGGTHVSATGDIGFFAIQDEGGVSAGVRRIEALTGMGAVAWAQREREALARIIDALEVHRDQAVEAIEKVQAEAKRLAREVTQLKTKLATGGGGKGAQPQAIEIGGVKVVRQAIPGIDKDGLRLVSDQIKAQIKSGIVVLASENDGKVQIVVAVTPDLTGRIKAGQIVKEIAPIVGGGGGGRPDFAEAGGKQPEKIEEMLAATESVIGKLLGGG